jgi:DNA topoisomerase III
MAEIAKMAERIVRKAKEYDRDTIPGDYATLATPCPNCGGVVKENYRRFACTGGGRRGPRAAASRSPRSRPAAPSRPPRPRPSCATRRSARWRASAPRPAGPSPPSSSWCTTTRSQLEARVRLRRRRQGRGRRRAGDGEPVDFSASRAWAPAPSARAVSTSTAASYVCEHAVGAHVTCDFKTGKIILQQPVAHEEMTKLLATGKTACWRTSCPTRRGASSRPTWPGTRRKARSASSSSRASAALPAKKAAAKKTRAARLSAHAAA